MYSPSVLIVSKRKELSIRYKKILKLLSADTVLVETLVEGNNEIKNNEYEFLIISDTVDGDIKDFVNRARHITKSYRPTIIVVSKSAEISDRLEILNAGADDFLSEAMQNREFQARLNAHIRRHIENLTNPLTGFLSEKLTRKNLKNIIKKEKAAALILLSIQKIDYYKEIYGEIAYEKVLQTIGAIISSALTKEDTIGHFCENEFLIFTDPIKAEKLAEFIAFAFDNVLKRFYSEYDYSNNFLMYSTSTKEEKKVSLMSAIEAVIEYSPNSYKNDEDVVQTLYNMLKPLKNSEKSTYIIDRPKLYGKIDDAKKNKILIMEKDEALGLLIETSCVIKGYTAQICSDYGSFIESINDFRPNLIILDYGIEKEALGLSALKEAKEYYSNSSIKMPYIIFSTSVLDKKAILSHGADFYLPKPYDIQTLIKAIDEFLK